MPSFCFRESPHEEPHEEPEWQPVTPDDTSDDSSDSSDKRKSRKRKTPSKDDAAERKRLSAKRFRQSMSPEQRIQYNEKSRLRMQRYRDRNKMQPKPKLTSREQNALRKKWREAKRSQRDRMSEEDKKKLAIKRAVMTLTKLQPEIFKETIETCLTPKKKAVLESIGIYHTPKSRQKMQDAVDLVNHVRKQLKYNGHKDKKTMQMKRNICRFLCQKKRQAQYRVLLGIARSTWSKMHHEMSRKVRSDRDLSGEKDASEYLIQASTPLPDKRRAGKSVLGDTLKNLHKAFMRKSGKKMCLSKFKSMKPSLVLTVKHNVFVGCICEYCLNLGFLVSVLVKLCNVNYTIIIISCFS